MLYRATPIYEGNNLVASGVQIEAWSVEDKGAGVSFNVYCYNVQPGVNIDYATGDSTLAEAQATGATNEETAGGTDEASAEEQEEEAAGGTDEAGDVKQHEEASSSTSSNSNEQSYVLNTSTKKFHRPGCSTLYKMKATNRRDFTGTRDEVISQGYSPCKKCYP